MSSVEVINVSVSATLKEVMQYVVGLSGELADRVLHNANVEIDGETYEDGHDTVSLTVGATVNVIGHSKVNVISAHLRTLAFYRNQNN